MIERRIRAVFFDAGNTLLFLDYELIAEYVTVAGVNAAPIALRASEYEARRAVDEYLARDEYEDEMVWEIYFSTMFRGVGLSDRDVILATIENLRSRNEFHSLWNHAPAESHETLSTLKSRGYRLGVISNADGRVARFLEEAGLAGYLDFILDSKIVGYEKPDPRIFRLALELAGEPPQACVHVGDIVSADVLGARGVGITPVLLDPMDNYDADCAKIKSLSEVVDLVRDWNGG